MRAHLLRSIALMAFLGACTSSIGSKPIGKLSTEDSEAGVSYHLAATKLMVTIDYELLDCDNQNIDISVKGVQLASSTVADRSPGATYLINPSDATGLTKKIDNFNIVTTDGLLSKIDYDVTDETGKIVEAVAETAAKIGFRVAVPVLPGAVGGAKILVEPGERPVCRPSVNSALEERKALEDALTTLTRKIGPLAQAFAEDPKEENKANLNRLLTLREELETRIAELRSGVLLAQYVWEHVPPKLPVEGAEGKITPDGIVFEKWLKVVTIDPQGAGRNELKNFAATTNLEIELKTVSHEEAGGENSPEESTAQDGSEGADSLDLDPGLTNEPAIYYRIPQLAILTVKHGGSVLLTRSLPVYQTGTVVPLEITNGAFQDNNFAISFAEGRPTNFKYIESLSRLKALTETVNLSLDKVTTDELKELQTRKAIKDARKDLIESEINLRDAEKRLKKAQEDAEDTNTEENAGATN